MILEIVMWHLLIHRLDNTCVANEVFAELTWSVECQKLCGILKSKNPSLGQSHSIAGGALALHAADPGASAGIPYSP